MVGKNWENRGDPQGHIPLKRVMISCQANGYFCGRIEYCLWMVLEWYLNGTWMVLEWYLNGTMKWYWHLQTQVVALSSILTHSRVTELVWWSSWMFDGQLWQLGVYQLAFLFGDSCFTICTESFVISDMRHMRFCPPLFVQRTKIGGSGSHSHIGVRGAGKGQKDRGVLLQCCDKTSMFVGKRCTLW